MLLKCLWVPPARDRLLACFGALEAAYAGGIDWESREGLLARTARLLPGLFLARVDGKSPVDYISKFKPEAPVAPVAAMQLHEVFRKQIAVQPSNSYCACQRQVTIRAVIRAYRDQISARLRR